MLKYFSRDQLTAELDQKLRRYDQEIGAGLGDGYRWPIRMRDWELAQVMQEIEDGDRLRRVLDTGSFNTFFPIWLARRCNEVIASDLLSVRWRKSMLRRLHLLPRKESEAPYAEWTRAVRQGSPNLRLMSVDLTRMPFPDNSLDCITSISVIEHIPRVREAIAEMYRCVRPGGQILITTDCAPKAQPYRDGIRFFTPVEMWEVFSRYVDLDGTGTPDFDPKNWCYSRQAPVVTAFIKIVKRPTR